MKKLFCENCVKEFPKKDLYPLWGGDEVFYLCVKCFKKNCT